MSMLVYTGNGSLRELFLSLVGKVERCKLENFCVVNFCEKDFHKIEIPVRMYVISYS